MQLDPSFLTFPGLARNVQECVALNKSITLDSLEKYKILGAGTFGQVWLVSEKGKKKRRSFRKVSESVDTSYALKIQYKRDLIIYNQVESVINEKNILETIDHPFVLRLVNTYKDELRVYMLMQLIQGGELFGIIHSKTHDGVSQEKAAFYAAGILEGLSYMHRRSILYRDLKGENVMIDSEGYCVLIDLGFGQYRVIVRSLACACVSILPILSYQICSCYMVQPRLSRTRRTRFVGPPLLWLLR